MAKNPRSYDQIIESIFFNYYREGLDSFDFDRTELAQEAATLGISNIGDILYTYRYRKELPDSIRKTASSRMEWLIYSIGRGKYRFVLQPRFEIVPNMNLVTTKILDATPGIVNRFALGDEQALLALLRYNRLVDIFTGLTCYSLQNHLRTTVKNIGQVEIDEIYVGVDKRGAQFVIPVQAKGGTDKLGRIQIEQDIAACKAKFPMLVCRPVAAQFIKQTYHDDTLRLVIALFELQDTLEGLKIVSEKHYRLVESTDLSDGEIEDYQSRPVD